MGCSIDFKHRYSVRFPLIWCECAIRLMENAQTWLKHFSVHLFFLLRMSLRCVNCIAGTDFDLWTVNQIWSPVPCEKIYLWYPQKLSVKELSWQAVFTGCGCIYHVYHCIIRIIIYILTGWNCLKRIATHLQREWEWNLWSLLKLLASLRPLNYYYYFVVFPIL